MTRVTIDMSTLEKLRGLSDPLEICDESGKTLGFFHPFVSPPRDPNGKVISPISEEELNRRRQQRAGRSLKNIRKDLR